MILFALLHSETGLKKEAINMDNKNIIDEIKYNFSWIQLYKSAPIIPPPKIPEKDLTWLSAIA